MIFRPEGSGYIENRFERFQFKHFGFGHPSIFYRCLATAVNYFIFF